MFVPSARLSDPDKRQLRAIHALRPMRECPPDSAMAGASSSLLKNAHLRRHAYSTGIRTLPSSLVVATYFHVRLTPRDVG
ncbi:MAG: hypothetical protein L7F78_14075, partial [Syntrophales bacterium LBB04]|nr:hypothetical protein [Syntrophales bacterium LBB04]